MTTDRACPWCGTGTGVLLGLLGCRAHFRCRQCGGEFSTTDEDIDYYRGEDEDGEVPVPDRARA